ncbi:MAG: hypothetical protein OEZ68_08775 [Gammaproteobacteria bacterium]|nr:hypothetical protein [Gammaproteobacteria bacterium]MDH5800880.1 hypothetical protein [Gammaproteobacteria bacterium]
MISVDSVDFSITRTSFVSGHICSIDYSYALRIDKEKYQAGVSFSVCVILFGDDLLRDKPLGSPPYDTHVVERDAVMPVKRSFAMPCEILDEAVGEDKIFIKICVAASDGEFLYERSATIHDWF